MVGVGTFADLQIAAGMTLVRTIACQSSFFALRVAPIIDLVIYYTHIIACLIVAACYINSSALAVIIAVAYRLVA